VIQSHGLPTLPLHQCQVEIPIPGLPTLPLHLYQVEIQCPGDPMDQEGQLEIWELQIEDGVMKLISSQDLDGDLETLAIILDLVGAQDIIQVMAVTPDILQDMVVVLDQVVTLDIIQATVVALDIILELHQLGVTIQEAILDLVVTLGITQVVIQDLVVTQVIIQELVVTQDLILELLQLGDIIQVEDLQPSLQEVDGCTQQPSVQLLLQLHNGHQAVTAGLVTTTTTMEEATMVVEESQASGDRDQCSQTNF